MNHEEITTAIRMIARGMVNHESVQQLTERLAAMMSGPALVTVQPLPDPEKLKVQKEPDRVELSPKRKR